MTREKKLHISLLLSCLLSIQCTSKRDYLHALHLLTRLVEIAVEEASIVAIDCSRIPNQTLSATTSLTTVTSNEVTLIAEKGTSNELYFGYK